MNYTFDNISLMRDGVRWFPVMGEIHYSRYPEEYWKEALLKMKAGGVDIVSSYVIWIHHEEIENEWDWTGVRNLRKFVQTVSECGLTMFLRVGPWVHAEVRNGGFPDWLCKKCGNKTRTNDEAYFAEVQKYFSAIFDQVKDLMHKDGGPIIGIQVENEFGHCGGLCGPEGEEHMNRLTKMLRDTGFDVPYWTATGWGGAVTAGLLPVMGGYCDAPWDQRPTEIEPSGNFVFTHERNDHAIGSDFGLGEGITFNMEDFPYLTAELGGGLQVTYKRRPVPTAKDIAAMSVAKMGSGCNLLGYYMYHGGFNPEGKLTTLQETTSTGSFCDLPVKSYDFLAPLGENGTPRESYYLLRELFNFVHKNGTELCAMKTYIPDDNPLTPENFSDLRYSVRYDEKTEKGFLFINNYQRQNEMLDHYRAAIDFEKATHGKISGKTYIDVLNGEFAIYSFRCNKCHYSGDIHKEFPLNQSEVFIGEYEISSDSLIYSDGKKLFVETRSVPEFRISSYKTLEKNPAGFKPEVTGGVVYRYTASLPKAPSFSHKVLSADSDKVVMSIHVDSWPRDHFGTMHDVFLRIKYNGNAARLYKDGKLVADNIYLGTGADGEGYWWEISLRRFGKDAIDFTLEVDALNKGDSVYIEHLPEGFAGRLCGVENIDVERSVCVQVDL